MTIANPITPRARVILIVSHYYSGHGGGIERVIENLIREIAGQSEYRFIWAASDTDPTPDLPSTSFLPMRACNVTERCLGLPWPIWSPGSLRRLNEVMASADIVWLHDTLYLGNALAFRQAKQTNKQTLITQHIGPIPYRNPLFRTLMAQADRVLTVPMLRAVDQAVFISDRVAEDYYCRVGFTKPVKIVPNGVDLRTFHMPLLEKRRFLRQQFALKDDQPVLLFVGRFVERKGLPIIKQLATQRPSWRFWFAGRGPLDPAKWMLPNVHVFRDRSGASLAELYHAADLLILPSCGEGFPLVIQEALACGLPVMCSPATAAGSHVAAPFVQQAEVWPSDPRRTANYWAQRLRDFPLRLPLTTPQTALADLARTHWEWKPIATAYVEIFNEMCGIGIQQPASGIQGLRENRIDV